MNLTGSICIALLLTGAAFPARSFSDEAPLATQSVAQLETRRDAIEAELSQLASLSLRSGAGAIGYRSQAYDTPNQTEWIQIELGQETRVDQVVLVPTIWRNAKTGFQADGFPRDFRLITGTNSDTNGSVLATFREGDYPQPGIAPFIIDCPGTTASWIRFEATKLSARLFDNRYDLEMAEIMVFSGQENVALKRPVTVPPLTPNASRKDIYLVDGFLPYLMDAAQGEQSIAMISTVSSTNPATLEIDLGTAFPLHGIHLHTVEQSDTVPQSFSSDLGVPRHLLVEGADTADFSDAVQLIEIHCTSIYETGPILMRHFPEATCRHVRLTAIDPFTQLEGEIAVKRFGFAEIELLSNARNVALGAPVKANFALRNPDRSFSSLTDGHNLYGSILPIRDWLNELARREKLENELPLVTAELNERYVRQQTKMRRLRLLAALLAVGIAFTILIDKILRMRQAARLKERFAADLHDELGANLHAIGFLGSHAKDVLHSPEKLAQTVEEINALAIRTGEAARYCIEMQTAKENHENLPADMKRTARRIIAQHAYSVAITGEEILQTLSPQNRADLFLFFKESLININRHADATEVQIALHADESRINLEIRDNGRGMGAHETAAIPASLQRRAKLLGATVSVASSEAGGTSISLKLKTPKKLRFGKTQDVS
ncbi:Sensor histidine kinase LiaS [Pontiella desulfatans]|uniref:Sensor histidine kinase LiaS n=1 Tax=Pontiella desulfatans TaxID=2750659 RepID=A0A6C2TY25_PONDE|nr:hypothetical protein [Pontiella desulfatans]VGO12497.1 Sensor histidine kinase LiaS [Pontiella desulfatans]